MKKIVIHENSNSGNRRGKRVKKLVTEKNFNWKIDEKLIVVLKIGMKFRSRKIRKRNYYWQRNYKTEDRMKKKFEKHYPIKNLKIKKLTQPGIETWDWRNYKSENWHEKKF